MTSRQRIEETDRAEPLLRDRLIGRVGERPGDAVAPPPRTLHRLTAAQEAAVAAVFVADAMLVLEDLGLAGEVRFESGFQAADVVRVHAAEPVFRTSDGGVAGESDHRPPAAGDVELARGQAPLPQSVVGPFRRERQALDCLLQLAIGNGPLGDVTPEQGRASGHGKNPDLEDARVCPGAHPYLRGSVGGSMLERGVDAARHPGAAQRRYHVDEPSPQGAFARTADHPFERIIPECDVTVLVNH